MVTRFGACVLIVASAAAACSDSGEGTAKTCTADPSCQTGGAAGGGGVAGADGEAGAPADGGQGCASHVAVGADHTCARTHDGSLWCWGQNVSGQLGLPKTGPEKCSAGTGTCSPSPTQVAAFATDTVEVALGYEHTCATKSDGTLWCWGSNFAGQLSDGPTVSPMPSAVEVVGLGTDVAQVVATYASTCARKSDGTLWCWGFNSDGQLGDGTIGGETCETGLVCKPSPVQVTALGSDVVDVAAADFHTCARKSDGTLWCWGRNDAGQLGDGTISVPKPSPVQVVALGAMVARVAVGSFHTCAIKTDGTLWCWGANITGALGDGTMTGQDCDGLPCKPTPGQVTALGSTVTQVAAAFHRTCALKTDGTLWCWGQNSTGLIGDGTAGNNVASPTQVIALGTTVVAVAVGTSHTCARKTDGTLWCWGENNSGQIGDGTIGGELCLEPAITCKPLPVAVSSSAMCP